MKIWKIERNPDRVDYGEAEAAIITANSEEDMLALAETCGGARLASEWHRRDTVISILGKAGRGAREGIDMVHVRPE